MSNSDTLIQHFAHFQWRVLQDALAEGTTHYWLKRAADLEAARTRPDDYPGHATAHDRAARDRDLASAAQACRRQARFVHAYGIDDATRDAIERVTGRPIDQPAQVAS